SELLSDFSLETYPNPNNGDFIISSSHEGTFNLVNELGQLIQTIEISTENNFETKMEGLNQGVYFVTGIVNDEVIIKKVVVN
ncbi:MAG: T9SS type A sorting domain-containing protein, partial [Bacteroidota bacterium]